MRGCRASAAVLHGHAVLVVPSRRSHAFCVGLLRPDVVVSDGLIERLSEAELRSVLAHERHHARRRDPLRRALVKAFCDGFWFIPALRTAARAQATVSELAADAVAMRSTGAQPLASALLAFEDGGAPVLWAASSICSARPPVRRRCWPRARSCSRSPRSAVGSEICLLGAPLACVPAAVLSRRAARALAV